MHLKNFDPTRPVSIPAAAYSNWIIWYVSGSGSRPISDRFATSRFLYYRLFDFLNSFTRTLDGKFAHVKCFAALPRETLYDFTDFVYLMNVEMGQADADWL